MAATIVGTANISFGGSAETIAVFTSFSQTTDSDKQVVVDQDGDAVTVAYFNKKSVATMAGYLKGTAPTIGASVTLANANSSLGGVSGAFYCDAVTLTKAPNSFEEISVTASCHNF